MARAWLKRWPDLAIVGAVIALVAGATLGASAYDAGLRAERGTLDLSASLPTSPDGGWSERVITVKAGTEVAIRLTSEDVTHGFLIPELGVQSDPIQAGTYQTVRFSATQPGVYTYYCYVLCSHRHGAMIGKLIVEP